MRYESHDKINLKVDDMVLKPKQTAEDFGQRISISVGESNDTARQAKNLLKQASFCESRSNT